MVGTSDSELQAERELKSSIRGLPGCWKDFVARLQSDDERTGDYYAVAHLQGALDDIEYAAFRLGAKPLGGLGEYQEIRGLFLETMNQQTLRVRRLAGWEMRYLLRRYGIYLSDLAALRNPELREGEITSIVQVRDTIERLIRLPDSIRPSDSELRELSTLDNRLRTFTSSSPWWEWVLEEYRKDVARWNASRFWWWGTPPD